MLKLYNVPSVRSLEDAALLKNNEIFATDADEELFEQSCRDVFGSSYSALPEEFLCSVEVSSDQYEILRWCYVEGFDLSNDNGVPLLYCDYFAIMVIAAKRGIIQPSKAEPEAAELRELERRLAEERRSFVARRKPQNQRLGLT